MGGRCMRENGKEEVGWNKTDTGKKCPCGGKIVFDVAQVYDPTTGPLICGPGSIRQYQMVPSDYYCDKCGVMYRFIPKE